MSIALRHKAKCLAAAERQQITESKAAEAPKTPVQKSKANHDRTIVETQLERDLELLSERDNVAEKIALKRQLLPNYLPQVDAYLEAGMQHPNPLLVWCLIWLIDVEDIEQALKLANIAIEQQQLMPERFKRDLPTYVAEALHDWAERQYKDQKSADPYFSEVVDAVHSERWPVAQIIVQGKLYKLAGLFAERNGETEKAVQWFERAMEANPRAGVKTRLEKLKTQL
ncbi:phage terminase small subunit [uncultured Microbulbifer sp.]|uniref:phage terminase small subunit n=1 Tax=uncultured Microbulbifer sp. TaxID=348147 RepID=UPI00261B3B14|nr:phage terminase small subunit [uncultured Microbulbifer sp.]